MAPNPTRYANDPVWSDVTPIPQDDGGPNALATIAYTDEYREASEYLRASMAANEYSERALNLTAHLIELNPAHYTVWLYRANILQALQSDIRTEIEWLNDISLRHIKNYQIWHHRQVLVERLASQQETPQDTQLSTTYSLSKRVDSPQPPADLISNELAFLTEMLTCDAKNYHVWSYRQWLISRFSLWSLPSELAEIERLLRLDVRNNSAWNHRWFVSFGREKAGPATKQSGTSAASDSPWKSEDERLRVWQHEMEFVKDAITMAPQNESSWNYLRGLLKKERRPWSEVREFAEQFAVFKTGDAGSGSDKGKTQVPHNPETDNDFDLAEQIRSSYALDLLADAYAEDRARTADADKALRLLATRYDPIRANYWNYRRTLLQGEQTARTPTADA